MRAKLIGVPRMPADRLRADGQPPVTPDGRYLVVRGRLWRASNPALPDDQRERLVAELMAARRAVGMAKRACDAVAEQAARAAVDQAKHGLGERGPAWWTDGAPDLNRHMARNTPYAEWFASLTERGGCAYWTDKFGVSGDALQRAVDAVGNGAAAVEQHLKG